MSVLTATDLSCRFGALTALDGVGLDVQEGEIVGILGPNGAGKSTLLNCLSGVIQDYSGDVLLDGRSLTRVPMWRRARAGLSRTFQTPRLLATETVWQNVAVGCEKAGAPSVWAEAVNGPGARQARRGVARSTSDTIELLGLGAVSGRRVEELPFARRRLVEIGRALVGHPRVLMCDEPAAGLEAKERVELAETLQRVNATIALTMIVVEHDVGFITQVATRGLVLDFGHVIAAGTVTEVLANAQVRQSYFGTGSSDT